MTPTSENYNVMTKPMSGLFSWLKWFFLAYLLGEVLIGFAAAWRLVFGSAMFGYGVPISLGDQLAGLGGLIYLAALLGSIIIFSMFSFRAVKNIQEFGAVGIETTPGWSIGWYFVPLANLWKPYGVMDEIWDGTHQADETPENSPSTLGLWWMFWIVTNIAGNISFRLAREAGGFELYATNVPLYKTTLWIDIFSSITGVLAVVCILPILKKISDKQDQRIAARAFT